MQAMTERPGTCFLQYPKVPLSSCNSFFDGGTCICSNSFKVSGGSTALPVSTKYPKILFLYLVLDIFQAELKISASCNASYYFCCFSHFFYGTLLPLEYHLYIGIVSHLGAVRLSVKIQQD